MSIYRTIHGLIFDDKFDTLDTDRWRTLSPSSAIIHTPGQLRIQRSNTGRSTNAMFDIPQDEDNLLMQVHAEYAPTELGEGGGITVWKNAMEKVEFLETVDSLSTLTYPVWRTTKRGNLWAFYAQQGDMSWELFDSTICLDPTMMGLTLRSPLTTTYKPILVHRVILCRGTNIEVMNVSNNDKVVLKDESGLAMVEATVPLNHSGVSLALPSIPFKGTIEVLHYDEGTDTWSRLSKTEEVVEMFGGDVFVKGTDLKIKWRDKDLSESYPTHVGSLKNDELELDMILYNDHEFDVAENVEVRVAAYFDHFGWKWVDIAHDNGGRPDVYQDTLIIVGTMYPLTEIPFWIRIDKGDTNDPDYQAQKMKPTNFYLEVVNS